MNETIGNVTCEYNINFAAPSLKSPVLFLHGWGGDIRSFAGAYAALGDTGVPAVNFAFPVDVPESWGIYDYAAYVKEFLRKHSLEKPIIVGHSFGGRVGIILASEGLCEKLVLVDSAGMRPRFSLGKKLRIARYHYRVKHGKPLDGIGSIDYNNLDKKMRKVFVRIVNTHLERLLAYIRCPTLIVWGDKDKDTPLYMAKRLNRGIENSRLVVLSGGHYSYVDSSFGFLRHLQQFITE